METVSANKEAEPSHVVLDTKGGGFCTVQFVSCSDKGRKDQASVSCNHVLASSAATSKMMQLF